jgi:hypothetical protein
MNAYLSTLRCNGDVDFRETVSLGNKPVSQIEQYNSLANARSFNNEAAVSQV